MDAFVNPSVPSLRHDVLADVPCLELSTMFAPALVAEDNAMLSFCRMGWLD